MWHFQGLAQRVAKPLAHPFVRAGLMRLVEVNGSPRTCLAGKRCPQTGIWDARHASDHPSNTVLSAQWWRQAFFEKGAPMPDARAWGLPGEGGIRWELVEPGAWPLNLTA